MEIEVGEYVRDKDGLILKYEYLNEYDNFEVNFGQKGKCITFDDMEEFEDYVKNDIVSHSKNIIDLIQEGDYVNGMLVEMHYDAYNEKTGEYEDVLGFSIYDDALMDSVSEIRPLRTVDIKSIVTKEQFSSVEYLLEEE